LAVASWGRPGGGARAPAACHHGALASWLVKVQQRRVARPAAPPRTVWTPRPESRSD